MASDEKRAAIRDNRAAGKNAPATRAVKFIAKPKPEASPLEDEAAQDAILNPPVLQATIGGEPVDIHELAAKHARGLYGLMQATLVDLFSSQKVGEANFVMLLAAIVAERYSDRIMPFIARSTQPAGELAESEVSKLAAQIDADITYDEMAVVLALIIRANRVIETLTPTKVVAKNG